jgi:peptide chain release factor 1
VHGLTVTEARRFSRADAKQAHGIGDCAMFENLGEAEKRFQELSERLSSSEIFQNPGEYKRVAKEHAQLKEVLGVYGRYKDLERQIQENQELLSEQEEELREMAKAEIQSLKLRLLETEQELRLHLLPKDPNDEKNILLEIRAGTGGDEAALFAADLFRMYGKYAESRQWRVEVLSSHPTGLGGLKEIIGLIQGERVYSRLKFEAGVHRVQRVPETEAQGRIHTSAVTVAVLPEADEVEVKIDPSDLRIDIFRSSGPGGQSVNTTDSAVRITHLPSGIVVSCQDEKSQHKNKAKAMRILSARLKDQMEREQHDEMAKQRRTMVGSGDRSQRIRTYNFPQSRVTDHRIGLTVHQLEKVLEGELDILIDPILAHFQAEVLAQQRS